MDKVADVLGRAGAWCGQNKYLSAIKNAFQNFMPLTIAGAIGVLWCNVLVNDQTGLGIFFKPIMALSFLNPAFQAVNFCTISCITVGIAQKIGVWNLGAEKAGYIPGLVIAIFIFSKREDNKAIASLSLIPGCFEINETVTFGIPFVLPPIILEIVGYVLTVIGFCPVACLTVPWTCPPLIFGFLATGANIMGAVTQAILIAISVVIYTPFLISYEKYQNKQAVEA